MQVRPLICCPAPRNIPQFKNGLSTIEADKLIVKYHHATRAYKIMRSYFLDHPEYTHLIIHPDDLVADQSHFNTLKQNIEEHDYQVISGICNVSKTDNRHLAVCIDSKPNPIRRLRKYDFVPFNNKPTGIVEVGWVGTPFMWIRRDVLEKIELNDDTQFNPGIPNQGWAFDIMFCYNCHQLDIPVHVNFDVYMEHLKDDISIQGCKILTGIEKPKIIFIPQDNPHKEQDITEECNDKYLTPEDWKPYYFRDYRTRRCQMI